MLDPFETCVKLWGQPHMMNVDSFAWRYLKDIGNSLRIGQTSFSRLSPRSHAKMIKKKKKKQVAWQLESGEFDGANGLKLHRLHCSIA